MPSPFIACDSCKGDKSGCKNEITEVVPKYIIPGVVHALYICLHGTVSTRNSKDIRCSLKNVE